MQNIETISKHRFDCMICGAKLKYLKSAVPVECVVCKKTYESNAQCENGHYICDSCHAMPSGDFIEQYCTGSESTDPFEMAIVLMRDERISMHGPEHHFLVPAVLLSAYYNAIGEKGLKGEKLAIARQRAGSVLGGFCGTHGTCGAAIGTGIFVSVITGSTPLSTKSWKLSNLVTGETLIDIAENGGPRCCKRDTFLAITHAVDFVKEQFNVELSTNDAVRCEFSDMNKQCLRFNCRYYDKKNNAQE